MKRILIAICYVHKKKKKKWKYLTMIIGNVNNVHVAVSNAYI